MAYFVKKWVWVRFSILRANFNGKVLEKITTLTVIITWTFTETLSSLVVCHKLVLKSVSYPKIVKNTPILIEQSIAYNVYT